MTKRAGSVRVLAIDPTPRGFGFVVLEGPRIVVDWGVKSGRAASIEREQQLLSRFGDLVNQYHPQALILEDVSAPESRRRGRVRLLVATMQNVAIWNNIVVRKISQSQVKRVFKRYNAQSKYEIACTVSQFLPEIAPWLPRRRKPWTGEDYRMAVFNAAALALSFFNARSR